MPLHFLCPRQLKSGKKLAKLIPHCFPLHLYVAPSLSGSRLQPCDSPLLVFHHCPASYPAAPLPLLPLPMLRRVFTLIFLVAALAHNTNSVKPPQMTWQQWHMSEEHRVNTFDPLTFFELHSLQKNGYWTADDILYIYGLTRDAVVGDGSGMGEHDHDEKIPPEFKAAVVGRVSIMLKADAKGRISREKWLEFAKNGGQLPDVGVGPGHHFDFETEYEKHHWNEYHREEDPDVHVKHKQDIMHELLHYEHEMEETHSDHSEISAQLNSYLSPVKIENIPARYLA